VANMNRFLARDSI